MRITTYSRYRIVNGKPMPVCDPDEYGTCRKCEMQQRKPDHICWGKPPTDKMANIAQPNLVSIKANGPTRTDAEVLYIIANHCSWCPNWNPTATKKKCKACGCGSTETVENLHRRRIKNCPRPNEPAAWTEQLLQARMNNGGENNS